MPRVSRFTPLIELAAVVLDTETTGLDVSSCRLVQVSGVRFANGQVLRDQTFDQLVNPGVAIPPQNTAVHGITDAMVAGAPTFAEIKPALDQFCDEAVIVGQSIGFDLAVLLHETERIGATWRQPQFLDTKLLAAALDQTSREFGLDALAVRLGVPIADRHRALGDALLTAEIFARLLPRLAAAGIRTLGDAEAHSNAQVRIRSRQEAEGWYDATAIRPPDPFESGRDAPALARLDSFAYRHRVEHVMSRSPVMVPPATVLADAVRLMAEQNLRWLLAGDPATGRVDGIVTQRDVITTLARDGAGGLERKLETLMSAPVATMPRDAFIYRAVARMRRLDVGQLPIEDASHRIVGVLALRDLLQDDASQAVLLGDRLSTAQTPRALAAARDDLPALARQLLGDGVPAPEVAAVLGAELRELLGRATVLAEKRMETEGAGRPPVPYAVLALGRVGRGECLLVNAVEHALVYASGEPDGHEAHWFDALAAHLDEVLRAAGVAASNGAATSVDPAWRRSLDDWRVEVGRWTAAPDASAERAASFFDFRIAYGDDALADDLRTLALDIAARAPALVRKLAPATAEGAAAAGPRLDLAAVGLAPIEALARALAVATRLAVLPTGERLAEACQHSGISRATANELTELHEHLLTLMLAQQDRDLAAGRAASDLLDLAELDAAQRAEVEAAVGHVARLRDVARLALALV